MMIIPFKLETKPKRSANVMYFLTRAFSTAQQKKILAWMALAAEDPYLEPLSIRSISGIQNWFCWPNYPLSHYLWCAEHVKKQKKKKRKDNLPIMYVITKKRLTALAEKYSRRSDPKDRFIAKAIRNIRDKKPYRSETYWGNAERFLSSVINIMIREWPYLDTENFTKLLAPSVCDRHLTEDQLWRKIRDRKRTELKRLQ